MKFKLIRRIAALYTALEKRFMPAYAWQADALTFWRERVFFLICLISSAGILPLIPSVLVALDEGVWSVALVDTLAYALIVFLMFQGHWPLRLRAYLAGTIFFGLGTALLFVLGPVGAGYIWLFGASIFASSIIGLEAAFWIILVNALTLVSASFYAHYAAPVWAAALGNPLEKMLLMSTIFLFFNTIVTVILGFMLNGLKGALEKERRYSADLRKSEERYRIVADFNYDWEYWVDPAGRLAYVSPSCQRVTGYQVADFFRDPGLMASLVHADDRPAVEAHMVKDLIDHSGADAIDFRIVRADGQTRWISHYCQPVFDAGGAFMGRRASNRDITDRKLFEDSIRLHQAQFLTVLNSIDAAIYVTDLESHRVLFMNRHMIDSYGRDLTGGICWQVLRNASGPCPGCPKAFGTEQTAASAGPQGWQERNPVTGRWSVNYDRVIKWTDGRPAKIQVATDITELKNMEKELRQAHKMEAIGTLAGGIAHDFNNILSAIIGFVELALDDADPDSVQTSNLREVLTAGNRAKELVRQILVFARQSDEELKPILVSAVAKEVLGLIRSSLPATVEIHQNIASRSLVMGNPTQLHQIIMNLCTNAAHAMEATGGVLSVELVDESLEKGRMSSGLKLPPGRYLRLAVSDTGTGIDPKILDTIFEPYFTTKIQGEGTGMGLAMVQGIVERYGGRITVVSRAGQGSVFTVRLPVAARQAARLEIVPQQVPGGSERILFVDDEPSVARLGGQILERLGYRLTLCTSSVEALERFRAGPDDFDLVITDMTMPKMTGDQLAAGIMAIRPEMPVILYTGYSKTMSEEAALKMGIRAFVFKPIVREELANTVRRVLDETSGPVVRLPVAR